MLFCSEAYALFFAVIVTAYWVMGRQWARAALFVVAAAYTTSRLWNLQLPIATADTTELLTQAFAQLDALTWMAVMIGAAVLVAQVYGVDRGRVWLLLLASYYFYACWNKWLATLILLSTTGDYWMARGIQASASLTVRRVLLTVSIVANLGLLVYFKYANFFLDSLTRSLQAAGVNRSMPVLEVLLPIGISFYTFEAINYVVDIYRGHARAERNLANFVLFITFFPHLVAGPIVRARDFLPQMQRRKQWSWLRAEIGVRYFLLGLFKKLAIADRMSEYVDPVFADPSSFGSTACWLAVIAYAIQIYGDFSGYSDMAVGSAHLLGYRLAENFNMPYLAANPAEFWHRWHISLSSWLRDYLFIPLGGSRGSSWRTRFNLLATMALGGLWHGASWTFVVWGVLHGLWLIAHRDFRSFCQRRPSLDRVLQSAVGTVGRIAVTLFGVMLCWIFFRATSFESGWFMMQRLFVPHSGPTAGLARAGLVVSVVVLVLGHLLGATQGSRWLLARAPAPVLGVAYAAALTITLTLAPSSDARAFIYFQF